jgi:glycosyltransferase involved in cell wall biosynthesis
MSNAPRISVVIPVFNRARSLERAVRSVLNQSYGDFELVVVDDGSTDELDAVLARFPDARLRVVRHARNLGAAAARNSGVRASRGAFIAFLDSDDEWLPLKLERQSASLEARGDGVALCGYALVREGEGRPEERPLDEASDWYLRILAACNVSFGSCALVRRGAFEEFGYLDETMRRLEDWDWLLRYAARRNIATLSEPLSIVHAGAGWPSPEIVDAATAQIWERHSQAAAARSPAARRLLRSTVWYERAVARYHHGRGFAALWFLGRSIAAFPERGLGFYRNLARRGGAVAARSES